MNGQDMQDMLEKIAGSAQDIEIPGALEPDQIEKRLMEQEKDICKDRDAKKRKRYRALAIAACLCLCFGAGSAAYIADGRSGRQEQAVTAGQEEQERAWEEKEVDDAAVDDAADAAETYSDLPEEAPLQKMGKYKLAADYEEVYKAVQRSQQDKQSMKYAEDQILMNSIVKSDADTAGVREMDTEDTGANAKTEGSVQEEAGDGTSHSTTNLQVEGVDESDIVKTDGKYIYVVQEEQVQVLNVQDPVPKAVAAVTPQLNEDTDRICEMYVADDRLTIIVQTEKTSIDSEDETKLRGQVPDEYTTETGEDIDDVLEQDVAQSGSGIKQMGAEDADVYYIHNAAAVKVLSYDITDPQRPVLKGTAEQDGWYQDSRKVGGHMYLFTDTSMYPDPRMDMDQAISRDHLGGWIPCVNGEAVKAEDIYLPREGGDGFVMSSIDLSGGCSVLDTKLLVSNYTEQYVTRDSVYLYYTDYVNGVEKTRIVRFALNTDGTIQAKAAATLKGSITDTFAIHERENCLQVLTSLTTTDPWENRVYVLDMEDLDVMGKLTGLAKGEQIYSARFLGATGYFVTYRNTDPLFTVDFSDPKDPKVIGELKVTGFSEYLHFWGKDKLLGIGQETDPQDGRMKGIKLSMFDISDPSKVTEEAKTVIEDADWCEGMYEYKSVLVDPQKNVIAFTTESYRGEYREDYRVFSYIDGGFSSRLVRTVKKKDAYRSQNWRSLYIGDRLYLVNDRRTIVFDMADGWKEIGKVRYEDQEKDKKKDKTY